MSTINNIGSKSTIDDNGDKSSNGDISTVSTIDDNMTIIESGTLPGGTLGQAKPEK